uniref:WH1 domain-containing protein n=1 Tax=Mesocestoides corti TaxID=53468 RepID=A0A5K3F4G1_MESCO
MGELPVFTCQAHVFTIDPSTRRSWVQASSKAIDINFFYDSNKQCYRIVSVEDGPAGKKVVINSTITPKMVFKQTSQKFGQWADPKSSGVFGLGFDSETDLNKFVTQFRQCVEFMKQSTTETTNQSIVKSSESQPSTLKNGQSVAPVSLPVVDRNTLPPPTPPGASVVNAFQSGIVPAPIFSSAVTSESCSGADGQQVMQQQAYYQAHIQRLERELEAVRRQASRHADSGHASSPLKSNFENVDLRDGLDRIHLASSSDGGSTTGGSSLVRKLPLLSSGLVTPLAHVEKVPSSEQLVGGDSNVPSDSTAMLLKLHARLGSILRDACDLHKQIGFLLSAASGQPT